MEIDIQKTNERWRIRRGMALTSFRFVLLKTIIIFAGAVAHIFDKDMVSALSVVLGASYTFHIFIITAYFKFSTDDDIAERKKPDE